jgi:hypothetical protein
VNYARKFTGGEIHVAGARYLECAPAPRGPDEHARPIGYGVIALAFVLADRG